MTKLNRAEYFELKVQGYSDAQIAKKHGVKLTLLKAGWGFTGMKTQHFMDLMALAKEEERP